MDWILTPTSTWNACETVQPSLQLAEIPLLSCMREVKKFQLSFHLKLLYMLISSELGSRNYIPWNPSEPTSYASYMSRIPIMLYIHTHSHMHVSWNTNHASYLYSYSIYAHCNQSFIICRLFVSSCEPLEICFIFDYQILRMGKWWLLSEIYLEVVQALIPWVWSISPYEMLNKPSSTRYIFHFWNEGNSSIKKQKWGYSDSPTYTTHDLNITSYIFNINICYVFVLLLLLLLFSFYLFWFSGGTSASSCSRL